MVRESSNGKQFLVTTKRKEKEVMNTLSFSTHFATPEEAKKEWHLIDKAKGNARQVLENLISTFGYTGEITFAED